MGSRISEHSSCLQHKWKVHANKTYRYTTNQTVETSHVIWLWEAIVRLNRWFLHHYLQRRIFATSHDVCRSMVDSMEIVWFLYMWSEVNNHLVKLHGFRPGEIANNQREPSCLSKLSHSNLSILLSLEIHWVIIKFILRGTSATNFWLIMPANRARWIVTNLFQ